MSDDILQPPVPTSATSSHRKKRKRLAMEEAEVYEYLMICEKYQVLNPKANKGSLQSIKEKALKEYEGSEFYGKYQTLTAETNWCRMQSFAR